jgi:hypothetical protein
MRYNAMLKEARMIAPQTEEQTSGGQYGHLSIHIEDVRSFYRRKKKKKKRLILNQQQSTNSDHTLRFCHWSVAYCSVALYGHSEALLWSSDREEQGLGLKKKKKSARSRTSQIKNDSYYRNARLPSENRKLNQER